MKLFNTAQIREADNYTIQHEPVSSLNLMERAANAFVKQFSTDYPDKKNQVYIFCGNGNNGGDGLAIARLLFKLKYTVHVFTFPSKKCSDDYLKNEKRLGQSGYTISLYSAALMADSGFVFCGTATEHPPAGGNQFFVGRMDKSGNLLWSNTYAGGNNNNFGRMIKATPDGGCIFTGYFEDF